MVYLRCCTNKLSKSPSTLTSPSFMSIGQVPDEWRSAILTPVHKGSLASIISNYTPISLTCVASKVMEKVVVVNLLTYLPHRNLISKQRQHSFLSGKSTTTNILESLADWTLTLKTDTLLTFCTSLSQKRSIRSVINYFLNFVRLV